MEVTSYDGAFVERWPEAQEFMDSVTGEEHLGNSTGGFRETAQGRLAQAILILRTDGYRSGASRVQRVRDLVRVATGMAPQDPHVLLYAAMIMLDVRDLRQAGQHVKSLRRLGDDFAALLPTVKAQAAVLHVVGRLISAGGRDPETAEDFLAAAAELDPAPPAYQRALELHRPAYQQVVQVRERPSVDQVFARLPI